MLRNMTDLQDYSIGATDGTIGRVKDLYFDDEAFVVRYFVVEAGGWLSSRRVLISAMSIGSPNWEEQTLPVSITRDQVKNSPDIDTDRPVCRQHEMRYLGFYGYPYYWGGRGLWGHGPHPGLLMSGLGYIAIEGDDGRAQSKAAPADEEADAQQHRHDDRHLRSGKEIMTYRIQATDGDIGHVQGFLVDEKTWAIRYMIINTSNWWVGHEVLISPQWIDEVRWDDNKVSVSLTRDAVRSSPAYSPQTRVDRDEETRIYDHYGRPGYWAREVRLQNPEFGVVPSASPDANRRDAR
jgi:PRC-barrel domain